MQAEDLTSIDPNTDFTQILPIQQKRTVAFINHFVMNTVSFLNTFAQSCESRLIEFEYKLQKVEASLLIIESQLSSISGLTDEKPKPQEKEIPNVNIEVETTITTEEPVEEEKHISIPEGIKACEDSRFKKFFKMVQFGVPPPAVKIKMEAEGIDPNILDKPNEVIPGFSTDDNEADDDRSSTTS